MKEHWLGFFQLKRALEWCRMRTHEYFLRFVSIARTYTSPSRPRSNRIIECTQGNALRTKWTVLACLSLCATLSEGYVTFATNGSSQVSIPPFVAEGTISTRYFADPRTTNATRSAEASMVFWYSNGWWQVECTFASPEQMAGLVQNCSRISDGVRYRIFQSKENRDNASKVWPTATALAISIPPPSMVELLVAWLALCPDAELPIIDSKQIRRFNETQLLDHPMNVGTYSAKFLESGGALLSELIITNNGFRFGPDHKATRCPGPFKDGFVETMFEVTHRTNVNAISFPLCATFSRFLPRPGGKSKDDLRLGAIIRLAVNRIGGFDTNLLRQHATPTQLIALDKRARNLPGGISVNHMVTNDQWLPAKDPRIAALVAAYTGGAKPHAKHHWIVLGIFVVFTLLPITIYLFRKKSVKNIKTETL